MRRFKSKFRPPHLIRRFKQSEEGSFTLEAVIWMPIFAILLAIVMNLSMVFYYESQMLRVAQDATRAYSIGKFVDTDDGKTAAQNAEQYISDRLAFIGAEIDVQMQQVGFVVQAIVSTDAAQLMPFDLMSGPFDNVAIGVSTQYIVEF